jgi:putative salt-induced outer membrane protein YdiY
MALSRIDQLKLLLKGVSYLHKPFKRARSAHGSHYSLIDSFLSFGKFIVTSDRTNGFKDIVIIYFGGKDN